MRLVAASATGGSRSVFARLGIRGASLEVPDAFHAEFGAERRRHPTTSVTVAISGAWCVEWPNQLLDAWYSTVTDRVLLGRPQV
jgi:hypothetical protein